MAPLVHRHGTFGHVSWRLPLCKVLLSQGLIYLSCFTVSLMAIKSQLLRDRGLLASVIPTMLKACKSTSQIYYLPWNAYISWCEDVGWHLRSFSVYWILAFLQHGVDQKMALSIKVQISALAIFFIQHPSATYSLVSTFI